MERYLPRFQEQNPQLELVTQVQRGRHPYMDAIYGAPGRMPFAFTQLALALNNRCFQTAGTGNARLQSSSSG